MLALLQRVEEQLGSNPPAVKQTHLKPQSLVDLARRAEARL